MYKTAVVAAALSLFAGAQVQAQEAAIQDPNATAAMPGAGGDTTSTDSASPAASADSSPPTDTPSSSSTDSGGGITTTAENPPPADGLAGLQDRDYLAILGHYLRADKDRGGENYGGGASWLYGHHTGSGFGYEAIFGYDVIEAGSNNGGDFYRYTLGGDLTYSFGNRQHLTPFLLVGGGGDFNDVHPRTHNGPSGYVEGGAGLVSGTFWQNRVRLRAEGRYIHDFNAGGLDDIRASLGLEIPFYETKPYQAPPTEAPTQVVKIVKTGLEDSDGDGVIDQKDKCPDTPPNTRVDGDGCTLPKILRLNGVTFEFNKARLRPDAETILGTIVDIMKRYPDLQVEIAGYTDNVGSDAYNLKLSQKRAESVRQFLIDHGVPAAQMTARGFGKNDPETSNDTDEGRERNRRVELHTLN